MWAGLPTHLWMPLPDLLVSSDLTFHSVPRVGLSILCTGCRLDPLSLQKRVSSSGSFFNYFPFFFLELLLVKCWNLRSSRNPKHQKHKNASRCIMIFKTILKMN